MSFFFGFSEIANDAPYRAAYNKNEIVLERADADKDIAILLNDWREAGKKVGRKIGIMEERKRIIELIWDTKIEVPKSKKNTKRDLEAMEYALWQYCHNLVAAIKGKDK